MGSAILRAGLLLLLGGTLAAFGGTYRWSTFPILLASAGFYWASRTKPLARSDSRLDRSLVAILAAIALQLIPLPPAALQTLSPYAERVRMTLRLDAPLRAPTEWWPLTVDSTATWYALATWAAAIFTFWGARRTFTAGGGRALCRAIGWMGVVICLAGIIQRASAPGLLYGFWDPQTRNASPFGPYIDRNLFAGWLVLAIPLVVGYLAAHIRVHVIAVARGPAQYSSLIMSSGAATIMVSVVIMTLTLVLTLSRSGMVATAAAGMTGWWLANRRGVRDTPFIAGFVLLAALVIAVGLTYGNPIEVIGRFKSTLDPTPRSRMTIWRETLPIIRDFWLTGTGAGAYGRAMLVYQQSDPRFFINFAHNQYLQLAAEGGVLLTIPVVAAAMSFARIAWRSLKSDTSEAYWLRVGAGAAIVGSLVQGIWDWPVQMPGNALLVAAAAALLVAKREPAATATSGDTTQNLRVRRTASSARRT